MATALVIGDQHFQVSNMKEVDLFIARIKKTIQHKKPDIIVCLGDLLHTHERLHTIPMNKALDFLDMLRKLAPVYSLIGNHDMTSHHNFLSDNHWQNSVKKWKDITVVDKVIVENINNIKLVFSPYVYPGRFEEALSSVGNEWRNADCIFAHQEFFGCKMGAIISEEGDKWSESYPHVISGHIHMRQKPQRNIYYTGSAMQHAFGESTRNTIAFVKFKEGCGYDLEEIDLGLPRKKIVYKDFNNINDYEVPETDDKIKICIKGTYSEFKNFKKSSKYKKIIKSGIQVVYSCDVKDDAEKEYEEMSTLSFGEILHNMIEKENNSNLQELYKRISKI